MADLQSSKTAVQTTYILRRFLEQLSFTQQFAALSSPAEIPAGAGNKCRWLHAEAIALSSDDQIDELSPSGGKLSSFSFSEVSGTLKQYGKWMPISRLARDTMVSTAFDQIAERFAEWGYKRLETNLYNEALNTTSYFKAGESKVNTGTLTSADTAKARDFSYMKASLVTSGNIGFPQLGGKFAAVLHPDQVAQLQAEPTTASGLPTWSTINTAGDVVAQQGPIAGMAGSLYGIQLLESQLITHAEVTGDSVSGYQGIVLAKDGLGHAGVQQVQPQIIIKETGGNDTYQPLSTYDTVGCKLVGEFKKLDSRRVIKYLSYHS